MSWLGHLIFLVLLCFFSSMYCLVRMNAFVIKHMVVFINVKHFSLVDMGQNGLFGRGGGLGAAVGVVL